MGKCRRDPIFMFNRDASRPPISRTYLAAALEWSKVKALGLVFEINATSLPLSSKNNMSSAMGVFFIQKVRGFISSNKNNIPLLAGNGGENISP